MAHFEAQSISQKAISLVPSMVLLCQMLKLLHSAGLETEADAAVGAFVRFIQEAPPLHKAPPGEEQAPLPKTTSQSVTAPEMTLQAGLDQLALLRLQISQMPMHSSSSAVTQDTSLE